MKKRVSGLLALGFALFCLAGYLPAQHQEEFARTLPLSSEGSFKLSNVNGEVTISTWKEAKVEIRAMKKTKKRRREPEKGEDRGQRVRRRRLRGDGLPKHENTGVSVDYTIQVPEGVRLENVETVNGNVNVTGPFSDRVGKDDQRQYPRRERLRRPEVRDDQRRHRSREPRRSGRCRDDQRRHHT